MRINKRLVLGISIPVLIVGLGLFIVFTVLKTAHIYIMVAPESATITINGRTYKNGNYKLFPGKKKVVVSGEGIETYETEIDAKLFSTNRVAVFRKINGSYDSYIKSKSDYIILKSLIAEQEDAEAQDFLKRVDRAKNIFNELPNNLVYTQDINDNGIHKWQTTKTRITDYSNSPECPAAICILVEAERPQIVELNDMIEGRGYNLEDYSIIKREAQL